MRVAYGKSPKIGWSSKFRAWAYRLTVRSELTVWLPVVSSSRSLSARRRRPLSTWATRTAAVPQLAGRYTAATHVRWPQPAGRCMLAVDGKRERRTLRRARGGCSGPGTCFADRRRSASARGHNLFRFAGGSDTSRRRRRVNSGRSDWDESAAPASSLFFSRFPRATHVCADKNTIRFVLYHTGGGWWVPARVLIERHRGVAEGPARDQQPVVTEGEKFRFSRVCALVRERCRSRRRPGAFADPGRLQTGSVGIAANAFETRYIHKGGPGGKHVSSAVMRSNWSLNYSTFHLGTVLHSDSSLWGGGMVEVLGERTGKMSGASVLRVRTYNNLK